MALHPNETQSGLSLLVAPAGWGKSTLLGSWVNALPPESIAFLQVDRRDNEPSVFNRYLVAALGPFLGSAESDLAQLAIFGPDPEMLGSEVAEILWGHKGKATLVLDDLHLVTSPATMILMTSLVSNAPPTFQLVVGARSDPAISVSRLRAEGRLAEVRMADLAFTLDEASELLNGVMGLRLTDDNIRTLHERTEGWPTGTYLAGMSVRQHANPALFIDRFHGSSRHIVDYLAEEVLQGLDDTNRVFLRETSVLETLSAAACDAITGRDDSSLRLRETEEANLFLIPLVADNWYWALKEGRYQLLALWLDAIPKSSLCP